MYSGPLRVLGFVSRLLSLFSNLIPDLCALKLAISPPWDRVLMAWTMHVCLYVAMVKFIAEVVPLLTICSGRGVTCYHIIPCLSSNAVV